MTLNTYASRKLLSSLAAGCLSALPLFAEVPEVDLEKTSLTGQAREALDLEWTQDVTQADIDFLQPDDLSTLFEENLSVHVNGGRSQAQQIFINNIESTLVNVTIDGAAQNSNLYHHASAVLVEPELLKQVEVVAGAGSALDGPGALGGAIRFETKNAFDLLKDHHDKMGALSKGTYYHNGDGFRISQSVWTRTGNDWALLASGSWLDRDEYEDGNGNEVENSGYERGSAFIKLSGRPDQERKIDLSYEYLEEEFLSYDRVNINNVVLAATGRALGNLQDQNLTRHTGTLTFDYAPADSDWIDLETNFYVTDMEFKRKLDNTGASVRTYGLDIRNTTAFKHFTATYGLDYTQNDSEVFGSPFGFSGEEEGSVWGVYAQANVPLGEKLEASVGARYDNYDFDDLNKVNFSSSRVSPNGSLTFKVIDGLEITGSHARAYKGVGSREVIFAGRYPTTMSGEKADTTKVAFRFDNGKVFANGSIYKQSIDNYIYPTGGGSLGNIESDGYDFKIGTRWSDFYASVGLSHAKPEVEGYNFIDDLGIVAAGRKWLGKVGYKREVDEHKFHAAWGIEHREDVEQIAGTGFFAFREAKESYTLHNLSLEWVPAQMPALSLNLNVDNVLDKTYQDHTIYTVFGLNSPGREFRLSAKYEF